jgi:hypothetical protein
MWALFWGRGEEMKKTIITMSCVMILLLLHFTQAAAVVYKWVDDRGVVNFADALDKVPPAYRSSVEEIKTPKIPTRPFIQALPQKAMVAMQEGKPPAQVPPIAQTLVREGDFAIKLAEVLTVERAQSEAEAETMLASAGITPKNGWIADYPMTPDIIGELQDSIGQAVDSGKVSMKKDQAVKIFQDLITQQGLSAKADTGSQYTAVKEPYVGVALPPNYPEYYEPSTINDYYYDQGPPIVTYYPPPLDYGYLYSWVPYPFWCTGFWFPGFFVLRDFHRVVTVDRHPRLISNHFWDSRTRGLGTIDPAKRHMGNAMANISRPARGFASHEASNGASSILRRSADHTALNRPGGVSRSEGGASGQSNFRGGLTDVRSPPGYRAPSPGSSLSPRVPFSRPTYGSSFSHGGSFSHPGMGTGRSFSPPSWSGGSGFHSGGFGNRGFSGGGGTGFSGGSGGGRGSSGGGGFHGGRGSHR